MEVSLPAALPVIIFKEMEDVICVHNNATFPAEDVATKIPVGETLTQF